jgi:hypothetical protein
MSFILGISLGLEGDSVGPPAGSGGGGGDAPPITDSLLVYYNPDVEVFSDDIGTPAVDGDNIRQFNDQSGNGNTLDGSAAAYQPIYDTTTFSNGLASVKSINDQLLLTSDLDFNTTTSWTWYMVYKKAANSTIRSWFKNTGTSNFLRTDQRSSLTGIRTDSGTIRYVTYADNTDIKIMSITLDRSNGEFKLYINGSYIGEGVNPAYYQANPLTYTVNALYANGNAIMNVGNVLFYTAAHDATQVGQVSDWLNTKYSIY